MQKASLENTLFDFSLKTQTKRINTSIKASCYIYKENNNLLLSKDLFNNTKDSLFNNNNIACLGSIHVDPDKYTLKPIGNAKQWISIKDTYSIDNLGFLLHEGDVISFGNAQFRINELKSTPSQKASNDNGDYKPNPRGEIRKNTTSINQPSLSSGSMVDNNSTIQTCRICLSKSTNDDNPLISPCLCSGSVKYLHLNCLKQWLKSKVDIKNYDYITMITYDEGQCELCKAPIPSKHILS